MRTTITELSVDLSARQAKRWRVDCVSVDGVGGSCFRKLVICKSKRAAQTVVKALADKDVLWACP